MRKTFLLALVIFASSPAMAERLYGMAGCGLGALAMGPEGGQISAATTNGTSFNQGFGISSGTLNCLEPSEQAALETQQNFFVNNLEQLSKEMAQGEGQYLEAFAQTFGCSEEGYTHFATEMKSSYKDIFASPGAMSMLSEVRVKVKSNQTLATQCVRAI